MPRHKAMLTMYRAALITAVASLSINIYAYDNNSPTQQTAPDTTYWLDIIINGKSTAQVLPVNHYNGHYWLSPAQLDSIGLSMLKPSSNQSIAIDNIKGVTVEYHSELQQLLINLPSAWLPAQHLSVNNSSDLATKPLTSLGALMNYDFYVTSPEQKQAADNLSVWTEQRAFGDFGFVTNTGVYRKSFNGRYHDAQNNRYLRHDTQWRYSDEQTMTSYSFGDVITNSLPWSNSVRIGGIQLSRNFSTRPDLITYPLPLFAGSAAVPSTVDLYINNYKTGSQTLNPGPFTLETQPFINGAGNATIVTTDALGRRVSTTVPFYVASELLAKGLTDYSVSTGVMRRNYGIKSADYSSLAGSGIVRHGYNDWLTLEGRTEGASQLISGGAGADIKLATLGILNLSLSASNTTDQAWGKTTIRPGHYDPVTGIFIDDKMDANNQTRKNQGQQATIGYSYNNRLFSINAQRAIRSKGYADLSTYKTSYLPSRRQDQVTGSIGVGRLGALGAGYFEVHNADRGKTRLMNLSWSSTLWRNINLYASMNREIGSSGYSAQFMLTIPLSSYATSSTSSSRDKDNHWVTRTNLSHAVPSDGGLGWNMAFANGGNEADKYRQADATWRSDYLEVRGGIYGHKHNYIRWGEMTGSLIALDKSLYAANTVSDAFALVSTNGFTEVPVNYENQLIGKTNSKGYLLVPSVTSWYPTKLDIDSLNLPAEVNIPSTIKNISIREQSGLVVDFGIRRTKSVSFTAIDSNANALPKGSVIEVNAQKTSWVGMDGAVWLEDIETDNTLIITRADNGNKCKINLRLNTNDTGIVYLDKQTCL